MSKPSNRFVARIRAAAEIRSEERRAAGRVGAVVWVIASLSVIAMGLVLPAGDVDRTVLIALAAGGCVWGSLSGLLLDYRKLPLWTIHLSTTAGIAAIAVSVVLSGGARSPAWACLFYVVVFAAYFFEPAAAGTYFAVCVAVELIVVLGFPHGPPAEGIAKLMVAAPSFIVLGGAIVAGKRFARNLRGQAERLAAEQGALRRVATAVVTGEPPSRFYELVAREAGQLLGSDGAGILRVDGGEVMVLGSWALQAERQFTPGARFPIDPAGDLQHAIDRRQPVRVDSDVATTSLGMLGYESSIVSPIVVAGRTWGFLTVVVVHVAALTSDHERRLGEFGDLIATAVTSIEDREALASQAATDALTGLANRRTFLERLTGDLARGRRHGSPVSVAIVDVDHFKLINDSGGHEAGDQILASIGRKLSAAGRTEDTIARVGGDEFAWILPDTPGDQALSALERARHSIGAVDGPRRVTISAGVCDSIWSTDPAELVRFADRALYAAKGHGRNQVRLYAPSDADDFAPR
ncbi:MAG: sensor domain-containing diguanylate cyclase [Solirubrobacteraceae bacterium]